MLANLSSTCCGDTKLQQSLIFIVCALFQTVVRYAYDIERTMNKYDRSSKLC